MRIQLDYYRILGLTPQAKIEQINQAYGDRIKSFPRREYSEKAISARQKLLNVANTVLGDSSQRRLYDQQILPELIQSKGEQAFFIEIDSRDIAGAFLILYELGEYDQIINLSRDLSFDLNSADIDLILSTVLAYLELGLEFWGQGKYETASENFNIGITLLEKQAGKQKNKSELFPEIHQELQNNLWKLRPYQVLELMTLGLTTEGIALLKELLEQRRGIDGKGDDRSGLNIDKFLQFILELRTYMTSSEQEELFEQESRRPSMVASYLAVYALVAKGVSQNQPHLIRRAKSLLNKMQNTQNVYFEEAICALLLGQLDEATLLIEQSNETEKLAAIQRLSKPENDLVKGLYKFTQSWLSTEIYPNFKELIGQTINLDAYFSDRHVQSYIDELPNTSQIFATDFAAEVLPFPISSSIEENLHINEPIAAIFSKSNKSNNEFAPKDLSQNSNENLAVFADRPSPSPSQRLDSRSRTRQKVKYKLNPQRLILFLVSFFSLIFGSAALGYLGWNSFSRTPEAVSKSEPVLTPIVNASIANIKPIEPIAPNLAVNIDQKVAGEIVASWQKVKAEALGSKFKVEGLDQILAEPLLSNWRSRAVELKNTNSHVEYTLNSVVAKDFKLIKKNQAAITTEISEVRNYFTNGKLDQAASKADRYQVEYVLTQKDRKWLISAMNILP